jgi:alkanesulfonate monooxygenase SsuD/methylene tetrahydromethanopterin reductase-like flavin-dependent oxidoreductase (luciferase family)
VRAICLVGDAAAVRGRLDAYRDAGADLPVVYPMLVPGSDPRDSITATIRGLAPSVAG